MRLGHEPLRVLLCLPPARTSNELELFRAMPDVDLIVASDRTQPTADHNLVLRALRLPIVGGREGWTAAPAWLAGLGRVNPGRVDVVVSLELFSFGSAQAGALARRLGVPHVVTVFETLARNPLYRAPPWRWITRRVVASADLFVCFSRRAADHADVLGCPGDRCVVVHPGVDVDTFRPPPGGRVDRPSVLFVGMLRSDRGADKGVAETVAACQRLAGEIDGLRLVMVGEGPLRHGLEARSAALPFLCVRGYRPRQEVAVLMSEARVLVLASRPTAKWEEQFGYVLVEAMASGLPVVATRSGSIPEVVPEWNPLVPEGDVEALAEGIRSALGDEGDDWGHRNRAHVVQHLNLARQGSALRDALAEVSGAWRRRPGAWRRRLATERGIDRGGGPDGGHHGRRPPRA